MIEIRRNTMMYVLGMIGKFLAWIFFYALTALFLWGVSTKVNAQDKRFLIGVPVPTQALFCLTKEDAQIIADNRGKDSPELETIIREGRCRLMRGIAVYVREVYSKDGWSVWELHSRNIPPFYEATDWKSFDPRNVDI